MNPALFALFTRSLRDDTRSRAMVWARAGMAVAILFTMLQFQFAGIFGAAGREFFAAVIALNVAFICIATLSYFAGAITEEKEDGTLGLLRMTNLNPLTILLGKSTSRLCGGLLLLLVQFPFSLLAVTLGGLRWEQVSACYAILAAFLFFAANAGLLGSVLARRTPLAALVTCFIAVPFVLGGEFAEGILREIIPSGNWEAGRATFAGIIEFWQRASVGRALHEVLYDQTPGWSPLGTTTLLIAGGCAAFLSAWLLFDRFCAGELEVATGFRPRTLGWMRFFSPRRGHGRAWWGWRMEALVWKDFQFLHGGWRVVIAKTAGYFLVALWILIDGQGYPRNWDFRWKQFFAGFAAMTFAALCAESLFAASRIFRIERNQRTLSSLAALPHDLPELIAAKRLAVLLSLLPVGAFFMVSMIGAIGVIFEGMTGSNSGEAFFYLLMFLVWTVGQFFLNLRLVALFSLRMKWGGLPLALTLSFLVNMFGTMFTMFATHEASSVLLPLATWIVAFVLKEALQRRIELAASED